MGTAESRFPLCPWSQKLGLISNHGYYSASCHFETEGREIPMSDNDRSGGWQKFKPNFGITNHLVIKSTAPGISPTGRNDMPEQLPIMYVS